MESFDWRRKGAKKGSDSIDDALAAFVASSAISFRITENAFFGDLLRLLRSQCAPPTRFRLAGSLLDKLYGETREKVDAAIKHASLSRCGAVTFDGWKDVSENHIVNVLFKVGPDSYFIESFSTSHEAVNAELHFQLLSQIVDRLGGLRAVCGVASDNTQACVNGKELVTSRHPSIFALQDTPRAADLIVKDLLAFGAFQECLEMRKDIRKGVRCNQHLLSLCRIVKKNHNENMRSDIQQTAVDIPSFPETRFAYAPIVMRQVLRSKNALRLFVEPEKFDAAAGSARKKAAGHAKKEKLIEVVEKVSFWKSLAGLTKCAELLSHFAHCFEKEDARIGEACQRPHALLDSVRSFNELSSSAFSDEELAAVAARVKQRLFGPADRSLKIFVATDAHYLAHILDPWEAPAIMPADHRGPVERSLLKACNNDQAEVMSNVYDDGNRKLHN